MSGEVDIIPVIDGVKFDKIKDHLTGDQWWVAYCPPEWFSKGATAEQSSSLNVAKDFVTRQNINVDKVRLERMSNIINEAGK